MRPGNMKQQGVSQSAGHPILHPAEATESVKNHVLVSFDSVHVCMCVQTFTLKDLAYYRHVQNKNIKVF